LRKNKLRRLWLALFAPVYIKAAAVPPEQLDAGSRLLFANYKGNYWHAERSGEQKSRQDSAFLALQGGFNLGLWQFRQRGNLSREQGDSLHWYSLQRYLQRPLVEIGSELSAGELYTGGHLFPALAYNGIALASDERMLSDNQRGYAPVVRGVAQSNARVSISQNGREIYQTTVSAGPFVIDDLSPTSSNGDLEVTVEEADGSVSRFSLPFAALPQSVRMGHSSYSLAFGRTRDSAANTVFTDAIYQYGLSNNLSVGSGLRVAEGYGRLVIDTVYSNALGAFDFNLSHSRANLPKDNGRTGWLAGLSYSRTFAKSNTRVAMAGYRYSTEGYRELLQVQAERAAARGGKPRQAEDLQQQRTRLEINLNQSLGDYGELFIAAVRKNWHGRETDDRQWQLGYNKTWGSGISLSLSLLRQYSGTVKDANRREETVTSLSISIPLGRSGTTRAHSGYQHSTSNGAQYDAELSGQLSEYSHYSLGASHSKQPSQSVLNGKIWQSFPSVNWQLAGSRGQDYWQLSSEVQGAAALHSGGLTFGLPLGDTFALVKAKNAKGARLEGYPQSRIDRHGYALVPKLTPYRYNRIVLKSKDNSVQEQQIAPYAGATVKLRFRHPKQQDKT